MHAPAAFIRRIALAVPPYRLPQSESSLLFGPAFADARVATLVRRVARRTDIDQRYLAAIRHQQPDEPGAPLYRPHAEQPRGPGMGARNACFEESAAPVVLEALSQMPSDELAAVDALITVTCTHAGAPGLERAILRDTSTPRGAHRWHLGFMGCSAGLAGLRLAHQLAATTPRCLVVACELSSLHFQYSESLDQLTANSLFGDGAAAALTGPEPSPARMVAARCLTLPHTADQMLWFADDHGLRLELSQDLPDTIAAALPEALAAVLDDAGVRRGAVAHWIVHPGGPQILSAVEAVLGLPVEALSASRGVLRDYGNMSSATALFILDRVIRSGASGMCVAMAFGPGLTIEIVVLELAARG